jgi:hypothetical protein
VIELPAPVAIPIILYLDEAMDLDFNLLAERVP